MEPRMMNHLQKTLHLSSFRLGLFFPAAFLVLLFLLAPANVLGQLCGDCDHDGRVTIADALMIAQHAGTPFIQGPQLLDCDANRSGDITIVDALIVARNSAGLPPAAQCMRCGDCNNDTMPGELADRIALQSRLGGTVVNSLDAACDTNGDGFLDSFDDVNINGGTYACVSCGDCDQNGTVDNADATRAAVVAGIFPPFLPTSRIVASCDVAPPAGTVNILDALVIGNYTSGVTSTLNCLNPAAISPQPQVLLSAAGYCVSGAASGTPWTANLASTMTTGSVGGTVPAPGTAVDLATAWATAIDGVNGFTARPFGRCFRTWETATGAFVQITITSTAPTCIVSATPTGCLFNGVLSESDLDEDADQDAMTNGDELYIGSDPQNPNSDLDDHIDGKDNCPTVENADQADQDNDGVGDACETANRAPVAKDDFAVGSVDQLVTFNPLANDLDEDDNLNPLSLVLFEGPESGKLTQSDDGLLTFYPEPGFIGTVEAWYKVCDELWECDTAMLGIAVLPTEASQDDGLQ